MDENLYTELIYKTDVHPSRFFIVKIWSDLVSQRIIDYDPNDLNSSVVLIYKASNSRSENKEYLGVVLFTYIDNSKAFINMMYVTPGYRNRGILKQMLERVYAACNFNGVSHIYTQINTNTADIINTCKNRGFVSTYTEMKKVIDPISDLKHEE
jgi:GNAT superfamily N-acetyltransferase